MLALISPAKKLDALSEVLSEPKINDYSEPRFLEETTELVKTLKSKSRGDLKSLMNISDNLADLNYERYQQFQPNFDLSNAKQAVLVFQGDTYKGLDADSLSEDDLKYAQDHLRILSGLYGILRPLDLMQPYRLEMGTKLATDQGEDLYDFWGDLLTQACNDDVKEKGLKAVVNLASQEYISAIDPKSLEVPFITCDFKEIRDGEAKTIGIYAKKARGAMARYIIENRVEEPEKLKEFDRDGYQFDSSMSRETNLVFTRKS